MSSITNFTYELSHENRELKNIKKSSKLSEDIALRSSLPSRKKNWNEWWKMTQKKDAKKF